MGVFIVPDRRFTLRIVDAVSGRPIPGARVIVSNKYDTDDDPSEMSVMQQVESDDDGVAVLPPLRTGELEARAYADGYAQMQEAAMMTVAEDVKEADLEIALEPLGESIGPGGDR